MDNAENRDDTIVGDGEDDEMPWRANSERRIGDVSPHMLEMVEAERFAQSPDLDDARPLRVRSNIVHRLQKETGVSIACQRPERTCALPEDVDDRPTGRTGEPVAGQ